MTSKIILLSGIILLIGCNKHKKMDTKPNTAQEVLAKAIDYHDPNRNWNEFQQKLTFLHRSEGNERTTKVILDNKDLNFKYVEQIGDSLYELGMEKGEGYEKINDKQIDWSDTTQKIGTWEGSGVFWTNFFTYLYGLPMKLEDNGTVIDSVLTLEELDGKSYYKIKAIYDKGDNQENWYYYFDQDNFALKAYKFYFDASEKQGEFISCEKEIEIQGIKFPKIRKWHLIHENMKFVGEDELVSGNKI